MADDREMAGVDVEQVIGEVKDAIRVAKLLDQGGGPGVDVTQVDLTLKVVTSISAGHEVKFKVPLIDLEFKFGASAGQQEAQTIAIAFTPIEPETESARRIKTQLVDGIVGVRRSLKHAMAGEVPLGLKSATVTLDFVYDVKGNVSLLVKGDAESKWANTVKLTLGPRVGGG